jgi:hypothetical protein
MSSLHGKLVGFNKLTGQFVYAAAGCGECASLSGPDGIGSYANLTPEFYRTFQPDSWQHAGSSGWTQANVPGWGENPNLQMFARRGTDGLSDTMKTTGLFLSLGLVAAFLFYSMAKKPSYG